VSLLSSFSSLVMQMPIFLTKLSDKSIIFISDVGKKKSFGKFCTLEGLMEIKKMCFHSILFDHFSNNHENQHRYHKLVLITKR
jgi:hypothetical protein